MASIAEAERIYPESTIATTPNAQNVTGDRAEHSRGWFEFIGRGMTIWCTGISAVATGLAAFEYGPALLSLPLVEKSLPLAFIAIPAGLTIVGWRTARSFTDPNLN